MLARLRNYFFAVLGIVIFYFLLTNHIIIFSYKDFELLKKVEPTLEHTFVSIRQSPPQVILRINPLRDAGIEEIMLDRGVLTEARLNNILDQIDKVQKPQQ